MGTSTVSCVCTCSSIPKTNQIGSQMERQVCERLAPEADSPRLLADHGAAPISKEGLAVLGTVSIPDSPCLGCPG